VSGAKHPVELRIGPGRDDCPGIKTNKTAHRLCALVSAGAPTRVTRSGWILPRLGITQLAV